MTNVTPGIQESKRALCTYFHRDECTIIINSDPLFGNIISRDRAPIQSLPMSDLLSDSTLPYITTIYKMMIYNCYQNQTRHLDPMTSKIL